MPRLRRRPLGTGEAKKRGNWVEDVHRDVLWAPDAGICVICGHPADPARWDVEHINPIDNGGEHSYANTAVAHPSCNYSKGGKLWPIVAWSPAGDDEPVTYKRGVLAVYLPNGEVRLGTATVSPVSASWGGESYVPGFPAPSHGHK